MNQPAVEANAHAISVLSNVVSVTPDSKASYFLSDALSRLSQLMYWLKSEKLDTKSSIGMVDGAKRDLAEATDQLASLPWKDSQVKQQLDMIKEADESIEQLRQELSESA